MWGDISIAFLLAFVAAFSLTPYTIRLANKLNAIDNPEKRRINEIPMPRLRGNSSYYWIYSIIYIFNCCNYSRKKL